MNRFWMSERNWNPCPLNLTWSKLLCFLRRWPNAENPIYSRDETRTSASECVQEFQTAGNYVSTSMRLMRCFVDPALRGVDFGFRPKPSSISAPSGEHHPQRFDQDVHIEDHTSRTHIAHVERYPSAVVRIVASRYLPKSRDAWSGR